MGRHETFDTRPPMPPDQIIARIRKALRHGGETHTWEDLQEGIITGRYQIFWNDDGACITEIIDNPQLRYLNVFIVAGRFPGVMKLDDEMENFGRIHNCKFMTGSGRQGWQKVLEKSRWKKKRIVFVKEIEI